MSTISLLLKKTKPWIDYRYWCESNEKKIYDIKILDYKTCFKALILYSLSHGSHQKYTSIKTKSNDEDKYIKKNLGERINVG